MKIRGVPLRYGKDLNDARTMLADVFSILLEAIQRRDEPARQQKEHRGDRQVDEVHPNAPYQDVTLNVARFARSGCPYLGTIPPLFTPSSRLLHTQGNAQKVKTV